MSCAGPVVPDLHRPGQRVRPVCSLLAPVTSLRLLTMCRMYGGCYDFCQNPRKTFDVPACNGQSGKLTVCEYMKNECGVTYGGCVCSLLAPVTSSRLLTLCSIQLKVPFHCLRSQHVLLQMSRVESALTTSTNVASMSPFAPTTCKISLTLSS